MQTGYRTTWKVRLQRVSSKMWIRMLSHEGDAVADGGLFDLIGRGLKRPVDEHGAADDVFAGNEAQKRPSRDLVRLSPMANT